LFRYSGPIRFCPVFFGNSSKGADREATFAHEMSHYFAGTNDHDVMVVLPIDRNAVRDYGFSWEPGKAYYMQQFGVTSDEWKRTIKRMVEMYLP
jgi:hypothetical protein